MNYAGSAGASPSQRPPQLDASPLTEFIPTMFDGAIPPRRKLAQDVYPAITLNLATERKDIHAK